MADNKNRAKSSDTVRGKNPKQQGSASTQTFLQISEIHDDTLILKNGGIRGIMSVSSMNFNLKSEEEQNSIIYAYQGFLNTLEFPLQIVVRSRKLDIDEYLEKLKKMGERQTNPLLQKQTYEYAEYISKLVEYADIMEKAFYVIVPFDPARAQKPNMFQQLFQHINPKDTYENVHKRHEEFEQLKKGLNQRINTVKVGLESCGLKVQELETKELIELFYNIYNPATSRYEKAKNIEKTGILMDSAKHP